MRTRKPGVLRIPCSVLTVLAAILISAAAPAGAVWLPDGLPVCTATGYQGSLVTAPDGFGGLLLVWQDHRAAQLKIYAQRIDATGDLLWTTNGVLVGADPGYHPWICADGTGGAYITWESRAGGYGSTFVQHLNGAGAKLWASAGISIAGGSAASDNSLPACTGDGLGGVIVGWVQDANPPTEDNQVVAQRMSSAGTLRWGSQGVLVTDDIRVGQEIDLVTDEPTNGALFGWATTLNNAMVQRLNLGGTRCMGTAGHYVGYAAPGSRVRVCDRVRVTQGAYVMIRGGSSFAVIAVDSTGYQFWGATVFSGDYVNNVPGYEFRVIDNDLNGAWAVWDVITNTGGGRGVYAQELEWDGVPMFEDPIRVSDGTTGNHLPDATVSYYLLVTWVDDSGTTPRLKYTHVDPGIGYPFAEKLVPGGYSSLRPCIAANDPDVVSHPFPLIAWQDERVGGGEIDIYAIGLDTDGDPTHPNLVATALNPATEPGLAGSGWNSFFVKVKNTGTCQADSFWTTIFPNQVQQPHVGDEPPGTVHSVHCGPLAAGDSVVVDVQITAPMTGQTWSMWAFADYRGDVEEFGEESDNTFGPRSYQWRALANLEITRVVVGNPKPYPMEFVSTTVTVKNTGTAAASPVWIDYFYNSASPPPAGSHGDQRHVVFSLSPGDSIVWTTSPTTSTEFMRCSSYFRVDTDNIIEEENEADNLSGPHYIDWQIPPEDGWPRVAGANFHSSPAIASLDGDPTTLEVVIGCDDGKLYAFKPGGGNVPGWPVTLGDSIKSSPAVGDIAGDYHNEVVVGCRDGKLYAYDYTGAKLWEYAAAGPVNTTPVLAELDTDDKLEIVFSSGGSLYALEGNGSAHAGSWPYSAGPGGIFTSPAVGNVDGAGSLEIAVIAHGYTKPVQSKVFLLKPNGTLYSGSWPAVIDTVVVADPVLGDVVSPDTDLEIVSGGLNGKVYVWNKNAALWPSPPRVSGAIETSPALHHLDRDDQLEIVVTSREYMSPMPPHWDGFVTGVDNTGSVLWTRSPGDWSFSSVAMPPAIIAGRTVGDIIVGSPEHYLQGYNNTGDPNYGFPLDARKAIFTSAAVGNIDDDAWLELVVAGGDSIRVWELCSTRYPLANLWWPMFRHDRAHTGCYGFDVPTGVDDGETAAPSANAIRAIYPNPFNPTARIAFDVSARSRVELAIYDVSGRRVAVLVDRELEAGRYESVWNGRDREGRTASSGVYFCRLDAAGGTETRKLVLIR